MKLRHTAILAILAAAAAGVPGVARAADATPAPIAPLAQSSDRFIQSINTAPDPSTAINAYADAKSAEPGNLAVEQAYLQKMVSFQLPEMAEAQARDIVNREPHDALAWSVLAYMHAKQEMTTQALTEISVAAQRAPDDPFVQRTAGQLIAWYDIRADQSQIPEALKNSLESTRKTLAGKTIFTSTYAKSSDAYRAAVAGATQPANGQSSAVAPGTGYTQPAYTPAPATVSNTPSYVPYTEPYDMGYDPYYYGWPYAGAYWYPSVFIFPDRFHHHHHDHDRDGDDIPLVRPHRSGVGLQVDGSGIPHERGMRSGFVAAGPGVEVHRSGIEASITEVPGSTRVIEIRRPAYHAESSTPFSMEVMRGGSREATPGFSEVPMRSFGPRIYQSSVHVTAPAGPSMHIEEFHPAPIHVQSAPAGAINGAPGGQQSNGNGPRR